MKNKLLKHGILMFLWLTYMLPVLAGPGGGDGDGEGEGDPDPGTPIDNWMLLLILAGIAVGIYFIMKSKRKAVA